LSLHSNMPGVRDFCMGAVRESPPHQQVLVPP
jgi:hypothetical protein